MREKIIGVLGLLSAREDPPAGLAAAQPSDLPAAVHMEVGEAAPSALH